MVPLLIGRWKGSQDSSDPPLPNVHRKHTYGGEGLDQARTAAEVAASPNQAGQNCEVGLRHQSQALMLPSPSKFTPQRPLANASTVKGARSIGNPTSSTSDFPHTSLVNRIITNDDSVAQQDTLLTDLAWHE